MYRERTNVLSIPNIRKPSPTPACLVSRTYWSAWTLEKSSSETAATASPWRREATSRRAASRPRAPSSTPPPWRTWQRSAKIFGDGDNNI